MPVVIGINVEHNNSEFAFKDYVILGGVSFGFAKNTPLGFIFTAYVINPPGSPKFIHF
jgi:hypothetical protein